MIYIDKTGLVTITSNVNNNSRDTITSYLLKFTHILSHDEKNYTIDVSDNNQYYETDRYCELTFTADFIYEGEYDLEIYDNANNLLYVGIVIVGEQLATMITYISDNEENNNAIYIQ